MSLPLGSKPAYTVNHNAPCGPVVMPKERPAVVTTPAGRGNWLMTPAVVIRPIGSPPVNHNAPSGPVVMPAGKVRAIGIGNSVIAPAVVMRPILLALFSVNHSAPSGPVVMPQGWLPAVGIGNSVITTAAATRPL